MQISTMPKSKRSLQLDQDISEILSGSPAHDSTKNQVLVENDEVVLRQAKKPLKMPVVKIHDSFYCETKNQINTRHQLKKEIHIEKDNNTKKNLQSPKHL